MNILHAARPGPTHAPQIDAWQREQGGYSDEADGEMCNWYGTELKIAIVVAETIC